MKRNKMIGWITLEFGYKFFQNVHLQVVMSKGSSGGIYCAKCYSSLCVAVRPRISSHAAVYLDQSLLVKQCLF
jgi:hypothetical protein